MFKTVQVGPLTLDLEGSEGDEYFRTIETWANANRPFLAAIEAIGPDDTCLDIGSNVGVTACLMSTRARAVHAFEALPSTVALLRRNLQVNGMTNVTVTHAAMGDKTGTIPFHDVDYTAGAHVVTASYPGIVPNLVQVPTLTLDDWADAQPGLPRIAFIKLDVEGFEPNVLAGGRRLIERDRPTILMELNSWCLHAFHGHSPGAFVTALLRTFHVQEIDKTGVFTPVTDMINILADNILRQGCISDLLLTLRPDQAIPDLAELTGSVAGLQDLLARHRALEAKLHALTHPQTK